jgi:hypothetical protein
MFDNYYTKSETYSKQEVNNLLGGYVTNDTFNSFKEEINQTITQSVNLDKIQKAINDGRNRTDALIEKNNTDHFNLYKYTRDADDDIRKELSDLKAELAVTKAIRPYQDKLIQCEMEKMFTAGINYTDRKTCNVIYGVVTLSNEPTVTGLVGRNAYGCLPCGFTQPASGTPAQ